MRLTPPLAICRTLTGEDCDAVVQVGSPTCGEAGHELPDLITRRAPGELSIRMRRHRPTLTVNEEFEVVDSPAVDDANLVIDAQQVLVSHLAQSAFTVHHQVSPETAIAEIRLVVEKLKGRQGFTLLPTGYHSGEYKRISLIINPSAEVVVSYYTFHFERLPSQVFGGTPSRFVKASQIGGSPNSPILTSWEPGPPLPLNELLEIFNPETVSISTLARNQFCRRTGIHRRDDFETAMREELRLDFATGEWRNSGRDDGFELLGRHRWLIAADTGKIILCVDPDVVPPTGSSPEYHP